MRTPVIFRVWQERGKDCEVFALFPTLPAYDHYVTSYQHIGQHCAADYGLCVKHSRPAQPAEYADLLEELTRVGYCLRVTRRQSPRMREQCRQEAVA